VSLLEETGPVQPATGADHYVWEPADGVSVGVRGVQDSGALLEVELAFPEGIPRAESLDLAAQLAGPLHWEVLDPETGTRYTPTEASAADRGVWSRVRAGLIGVSAAAAVLGGLMWRATGGGPSPWLLVALLGIGVYSTLRASSWIRSRLGASSGR